MQLDLPIHKLIEVDNLELAHSSGQDTQRCGDAGACNAKNGPRHTSRATV